MPEKPEDKNIKEMKPEGMKCPKCGFECVVDKVAAICPNCDYVSMHSTDWKGAITKCPSCQSNAKVYEHRPKAKTFVCDNCNTIGRYLDKHDLKSKIYPKSSPAGKKLSWLFEVPCKHWYRKDDPLTHKKYCAQCDIRRICHEHSEEIYSFCAKKNVEVYLGKEFIEIVHK